MANNNSLMEPLMDNGLIEVKLFPEQTNEWFNCYLLDVEAMNVNMVSNQPSTTENNVTDPNNSEKIQDNPKTIIMAKVAMAEEGEPASQTMAWFKNIKTFPLDQLRFKPKFETPAKFVENKIIEVKTIEKNHKYISWKLAKIKKVKSTAALVDYFDNDGNIIKDFEYLIDNNESREQNPFQSFSATENPFIRIKVPIPFFVRQSDLSFMHFDLYSKFKNIENLFNVYYDAENNSMILIGYILNKTEALKDKFINQCNLLGSWHVRCLRDTHFMFKNLPMPINTGPQYTVNGNEAILHLPISQDYVGLSIGKGGLNIKKAREIEGVKSIDLLDGLGKFIIRGDSIEACQKAAAILYFKSELFDVDKSRKDFFSNKQIILELVKKSNIVQVNVVPKINENDNDGADFNGEEDCEIYLVGTEDNIANFKVMFEYQFLEQSEISKLKQQVRNLIGTTRPRNNYGGRPMNRRRSDYNGNDQRKFADVVKS